MQLAILNNPQAVLPLWQRRLCFLYRWYLVCLFVCVFVCKQHYSKSFEQIMMKFYAVVLGDKMKKWLNFAADFGLLR